MNAPLYQAVVHFPKLAPGFALGVACNDDEILGIDFLAPRPEQAPRTLLAKEAVRQIHAYLKDPGYAIGLPLAPAGTHFQRRVWNSIAMIPTGQTRSYGDLARDLASAPRAVGGACGANPYPLVVPCHRVIGSDGSLTGYGGGLPLKRKLLEHEARVAGTRFDLFG